MQQTRIPTEFERAVLLKLLSQPFYDNERYLRQLDRLKVKPCSMDEAERSLTLYVDDESPDSETSHVPVEGIYDNGKRPVSFLLHVAKNRLKELEVVTYGEMPEIEKIPLNEIEVQINQDER